MFWSRPLGRAPEVTGPYCSHTRSGAAPPEACASIAALEAVMLALLLASHWTVTPLCAASYWLVSFFRPALSAAVIGPAFGGSTALMVTGPWLVLEPLEALGELPDEHPAARPPASRRAVPTDSGALMSTLGAAP